MYTVGAWRTRRGRRLHLFSGLLVNAEMMCKAGDSTWLRALLKAAVRDDWQKGQHSRDAFHIGEVHLLISHLRSCATILQRGDGCDTFLVLQHSRPQCRSPVFQHI